MCLIARSRKICLALSEVWPSEPPTVADAGLVGIWKWDVNMPTHQDGLQEINEACLFFERARSFCRQFVRLSIGNRRGARSPSLMMRHFVVVAVAKPAYVIASSSRLFCSWEELMMCSRIVSSMRFVDNNVFIYLCDIVCMHMYMWLSRVFVPTSRTYISGKGWVNWKMLKCQHDRCSICVVIVNESD